MAGEINCDRLNYPLHAPGEREGVSEHIGECQTLREHGTQLTYNAPGAIRTHGPRIRNPVLYPPELRGHKGFSSS
jgi:hypothetical protein